MTITESVAEFEQRQQRLLGDATSEMKTVRVKAAVDEARKRFSVRGSSASVSVPGVTEAMPALSVQIDQQHVQKYLDQISDAASKQYDVDLQVRAEALEKERDAMEASFTKTLAEAGTLPDPLRVEPTTPTSGTEHALRRVGLLVERDWVERRLRGKTPAAIADLYERADDRLDAMLRFTIEDQQRLSWSDIPLDTTGEDVVFGMQRLQRAIAGVHQARLKQLHPELVAAAEKFKAVTSGIKVTEVLRHVRTGRGVAVEG